MQEEINSQPNRTSINRVSFNRADDLVNGVKVKSVTLTEDSGRGEGVETEAGAKTEQLIKSILKNSGSCLLKTVDEPSRDTPGITVCIINF